MFADAGRLRQLLHNLVRNSQEAGDQDKISIRMVSTVTELHGKKWLDLEITDNGPGFTAVVLGQPFEPYISNKARGSGLGLAICKKIVSEHDGQIDISNPPDGGSRVLIRLPVE